MTRLRYLAIAGACAISIAGCASNTARQSMNESDVWRPETRGAQTSVAPDDVDSRLQPPVSSLASQQSGQGNLTSQVNAGGWKGIEYSTAVPVGQVILMALMLLFSHRREMTRIRQNGKEDFQAFRLSGCPGQAASTRPDSLTAQQSDSLR